MVITVGTSVETLDIRGHDLIIQNLGTGNLYWSRSASVDPAGPGIKIESGKAMVVGTDVETYLVADAAGQDVRIERV